jgi:hypothetical protein
MRTYQFNTKQWYRFDSLCKSLGLSVETGATYTYSNLVETEHCYLRVIRNNQVIAIANLID